VPVATTPIVGNFCWVEANLENPSKGKAFYSELFGWKIEDMKMPAGEYTMMKIGDDQVAGILTLPENAKKMGVPPHWLAYVAVSDAKDATKKAERLGAKVGFGPVAVGPGTMSVIGDPTGAMFALWESTALGGFVHNERHALCWMELTSTDVEAATKFYVEMFGWKTEKYPMGDFDYTVATNEGQQIAGLMPQPKPMAEAKAPSLWTVYFDVADCDATVERAKRLGGSALTDAMDIPNVGRFAILADPDGAAFAVITNAPKA
jgi:uncharacterized protein